MILMLLVSNIFIYNILYNKITEWEYEDGIKIKVLKILMEVSLFQKGFLDAYRCIITPIINKKTEIVTNKIDQNLLHYLFLFF